MAQLIIGAGVVVGRAFARAVRREIQQSQQAAQARANARTDGGGSRRSAAANALTGMTLQVKIS